AGGHYSKTASCRGDHLDTLPSAVCNGEKKARGIGKPGKADDRAVEIFSQRREPSSGPFKKQETLPIALVAGTRLRTECDVFAVRRIVRRTVRGGIRRDAPWTGGIFAGDRHDEQVVVRAGGRSLIGVHGEADFLAIGRDSVIVGPAEREGRHDVSPRCQVDGSAAVRGDGKQVTPGGTLPLVPMAVEESCDRARFDFARLLIVEHLLIAGIVGRAGGQY